MSRFAITLAATLITCSCTTITPPSISAIDFAQGAYDRIAEFAKAAFNETARSAIGPARPSLARFARRARIWRDHVGIG